MKFDADAVEKQTTTMTTLASILNVLGTFGVIVGCIVFALGLVSALQDPELTSTSTWPGLLATGVTSIMFGIVQCAIAATLNALRSIAVNCAKMGATSDGSYINVRARKSQ